MIQVLQGVQHYSGEVRNGFITLWQIYSGYSHYSVPNFIKIIQFLQKI